MGALKAIGVRGVSGAEGLGHGLGGFVNYPNWHFGLSSFEIVSSTFTGS